MYRKFTKKKNKINLFDFFFCFMITLIYSIIKRNKVCETRSMATDSLKSWERVVEETFGLILSCVT